MSAQPEMGRLTPPSPTTAATATTATTATAVPTAVSPAAASATAIPTAALASTGPGSPPESNHRWWVLAVLGVAQLMVVLDATVVNIALPSAQKALGFSDGNRQWIVTAYALAFGSLLLIGGRLADLLGQKRVFLLGLGGFAVASAIGGAANGFAMLVTARAVQGAFGALLAPAALSLLTTTFTHAKERAKAFGIFGAIAGAGAALGLMIGGFLTEYASWRWTLFVNLFFAAIALTGGSILLHGTRVEHRPKLDWPGTVTVSGGLFALVYGFSHAETAGWGSPVTDGFLIGSVVLLAAFVWIQTVSPHPLLPLRVLLDRNRGGAFLAMFAAAAGMFGIFLFLTYYLETSLDYSALRTGAAFLPLSAVLVVAASTVSTVLGPRVSPRILIPSGLFICAVGMALLTRISLTSSYLTHVLPATMVLGIGIGLVFSTGINLATYGVDPDDAGVASASVNTMQQIGGSVGTALLNTLAATATASYLASHKGQHAVASLAAVHSYVTAFYWSTAIFAAAGVICVLLLRSGVPVIDNDAEAVPVA